MPRWFGLICALVAVPIGAGGCLRFDRQHYEPRSFLGYACDGDCERHKAGFAWAERHGVRDPAGCAALARAPREGCRAYAEATMTPEQAGYRWALENEVVERRHCDGAGRRFRAGCLRQLPGGGAAVPAAPQEGGASPGCAEAWPGRAEAISPPGTGR